MKRCHVMVLTTLVRKHVLQCGGSCSLWSVARVAVCKTYMPVVNNTYVYYLDLNTQHIHTHILLQVYLYNVHLCFSTIIIFSIRPMHKHRVGNMLQLYIYVYNKLKKLIDTTPYTCVLTLCTVLFHGYKTVLGNWRLIENLFQYIPQL